MSLYRLLRSNKESGPFTQEEMIVKGFKPYDLIWVEGKSAGWRYPSELPEFKAHCPVTEEQPYDRFYKKPEPQVSRMDKVERKPVQETTYQTSYSNNTTLAKPEPVTAVAEKVAPPPIVPIVAEQPNGRHIHVTLPIGAMVKPATARKEEPRETAKQEAPVKKEIIVSFEPEPAVPTFQPPVSTSIAEEKEPVIAVRQKPVKKEKPSKPAVYATMAAQEGGYSWTMLFGIAVGIATFVGLGLMIGLSINKHRENEAFNTAITKKLDHPPVVTNNLPSKDDKAINNSTEPAPQDVSTIDPSLVKNAVIKSTPAQSQPSTNGEIKPQAPTENLEKKDKPAISSQTEKEAIRPKTEPAPLHLESQVSVNNNLYKVGAFGGISDLQCTLTNESRYALDVVEVEVSYIQANEKIYKTAILSFRDVAAGAQVTIQAPKSPRGIKVISRVVKINPKETGLGNTTVRS